MKKESIIIGVLVVLLVIALGFIFNFYNKNNLLNNENSDLINQNKDLSDANSNLFQEKEDLSNKIIDKDLELSRLRTDVEKIYKSCITNNACRGRYPGISWNCNNVGDETNDNFSHICICDSSCNLNATEIKKS